MKLILVRHAKAERGTGDDEAVDLLRPITEAGRQQAEAISELIQRELGGEPLVRIVSSPALRCQQTMEPLTLATGISAEVDERLGKGESLQRLLERAPARDEGTVVFCTHQKAIVSLLQLFELGESEGEAQPQARRGSVWIVDGRGTTPSHAQYFEPVRRPSTESQPPVRMTGTGPTRDRGVRLAALDLGSTSFTLLIADVKAGGAITPIVREKVMLRLGATLSSSSIIPEDVCKRAIRVAAELMEVARAEKAEQIIPVATAALREARNGDGLAEDISRVLQTPVRILSGAQEAEATFRAFTARLALGDEPSLGLDLGGGSLEIAIGNRAGLESSVSLPLGVARLHAALIERDPMKRRERARLRDLVLEQIEPHVDAFRAVPGMPVIAAGGSLRALARLIDERCANRTGIPTGPRELALDQLIALADDLVCSSQDERLRMRGMQRRRADLLPTAAVVISAVAERLGCEGLTVCDWGLREGILLDAARRHG